MKLIRLSGENVLQYKKLGPIHFPQQGLILILGPNGSGKSSLMVLIELALFGVVRGTLTSDMIKHQGSGVAEKWWLELLFEKDGNHYRVYRHENTTKAFLQVNGNTVQVGQGNVTDHIIRHVLLMDQLSFSSCFYARQDEFDSLVKLTDSKRKAEVSRLFRIDSIDRAAKKSRQDRDRLILEITEAKKHLADPAELASEKLGHLKQIDHFQKEVNTLDGNLDALAQERSKLTEAKRTGDDLYERYQTRMSEVGQVETHIRTLKEVLTKAEERLDSFKGMDAELQVLLPARERYQKLLNQKSEMEKAEHEHRRMKTIQSQIQNTEQELASYEKQMEAVAAALATRSSLSDAWEKKKFEVQGAEQELAELLESHQSCTFELSQIKKEYEKAASDKKRFEALGKDTPCPTCEQPLGDHYLRRITEITAEIEEWSRKGKEMTSRISAIKHDGMQKREKATLLKSERDTLREKLEEVKRHEDRGVFLQSEHQKRLQSLTSLKEELLPLEGVSFDEASFKPLFDALEKAKGENDRSFRLETMLEQAPQLAEDIKQYHSTIAMQEQAKDVLLSQIKDMNFDVAAYRTLSSSIEEKQQQMEGLQREIQSIATNIRILETKKEAVEAKEAENEAKQKEFREKERNITNLAKLDEVLKSYKDDKLMKLSPALSDIMSELMGHITMGKYDLVTLDEHYKINISRQGKLYPLHFYSGGEQKLAALIQRIAISRLIVAQSGQSAFDLIALDEVLGAFDEDRQNAAVLALKSLNHLFKQIFMITHSEHVKDMCDHSLEIYQDDKLRSHTRWMEPWDEEAVIRLAREIEELSA